MVAVDLRFTVVVVRLDSIAASEEGDDVMTPTATTIAIAGKTIRVRCILERDIDIVLHLYEDLGDSIVVAVEPLVTPRFKIVTDWD